MKKNQIEISALAPAVEAKQLTITRGATTILKGISCTLPQGKCSVILGPNGCGKTTFTRAITGHTFISSGSMRVLGEKIGETNMRDLRRRIGIVNPTTDAGTMHISGAVVDSDLTAHEAVLTGFFSTVGLYDIPTAEQHNQAEKLLEQVGLSHRSGLRFALLSTGEQRRCLIARALVQLPELLILDEPTAGLDVAGREQVLATVQMVLTQPMLDGRHPTVLLITHHVEEIPPKTAQILLMRDGQFIHTGTPTEAITPEWLTKTFGCKVFVKKIHGRWWLEVLPEAWLDLVPRK